MAVALLRFASNGDEVLPLLVSRRGCQFGSLAPSPEGIVEEKQHAFLGEVGDLVQQRPQGVLEQLLVHGSATDLLHSQRSYDATGVHRFLGGFTPHEHY